MEKSEIYDLLERGLLHEREEKIKESEKESLFFTSAQEAFEQLEKELNEQEKKLLQSYFLAVENKGY